MKEFTKDYVIERIIETYPQSSGSDSCWLNRLNGDVYWSKTKRRTDRDVEVFPMEFQKNLIECADVQLDQAIEELALSFNANYPICKLHYRDLRKGSCARKRAKKEEEKLERVKEKLERAYHGNTDELANNVCVVVFSDLSNSTKDELLRKMDSWIIVDEIQEFIKSGSKSRNKLFQLCKTEFDKNKSGIY